MTRVPGRENVWYTKLFRHNTRVTDGQTETGRRLVVRLRTASRGKSGTHTSSRSTVNMHRLRFVWKSILVTPYVHDASYLLTHPRCLTQYVQWRHQLWSTLARVTPRDPSSPVQSPGFEEEARSFSWPDVVKGDYTRLCLFSVLC